MPSGMKKTGEQTSTSTPWPPAGKAMEFILGEGKDLYKQGGGFDPFPGKGFVPFSGQTRDALQTQEGLAGQPNPFYSGASNFTNSLIGGGRAHDQSGFQGLIGQNPNAINQYGRSIASGAQGINVNPQLQGLLGQNANALAQNAGGIASGANRQTALDQYGRPIASGAQGIGTEGDYRQLFNQVDPEFENVVGRTANDLGDQISRQFGGASYGSAAHTGTVTDQVGDAVSRMRSNNFQQNLANKQNILGGITGVQGQNISNQLGAAGQLSGEQGQNIGQRLSAASALSGEQMGNRAQQSGILGQMGGFQGQNIANRLGAAGALSGEQQQGFANERGLYGDMANLSQQDIQNQMAGIAQAPGVYDMQYAPSQYMAAAGAAREAQAGDKLQWQMDRFNTQQQAPFGALSYYNNLATGAGAQGGTTNTTVSQMSNPLGQILGGGLLASQLFGGGGILGGGGPQWWQQGNQQRMY